MTLSEQVDELQSEIKQLEENIASMELEALDSSLFEDCMAGFITEQPENVDAFFKYLTNRFGGRHGCSIYIDKLKLQSQAAERNFQV
jgi:hypothetical protein